MNLIIVTDFGSAQWAPSVPTRIRRDGTPDRRFRGWLTAANEMAATSEKLREEWLLHG